MKALRQFITRLNACIAGQRQEERLRREMEEHLALQTEETFGLAWHLAKRAAKQY